MGRVKVRHHVDPLHEQNAGSETDDYNDDYHIQEDGAKKRVKPPKPIEKKEEPRIATEKEIGFTSALMDPI